MPSRKHLSHQLSHRKSIYSVGLEMSCDMKVGTLLISITLSLTLKCCLRIVFLDHHTRYAAWSYSSLVPLIEWVKPPKCQPNSNTTYHGSGIIPRVWCSMNWLARIGYASIGSVFLAPSNYLNWRWSSLLTYISTTRPRRVIISDKCRYVQEACVTDRTVWHTGNPSRSDWIQISWQLYWICGDKSHK